MRIQLWTPLILSLCLLTTAFCQTSGTAAAIQTPVGYDIVSIHEHNADDGGMMWRFTPDGITNANVPLNNLASSAFQIKMDLVSGGPAWVYNKGFDISAKLLPGDDGKPVKLTEEQRETLLRALLADRFHLQAHVETKILPTYDLVVVKSGTRMKLAPPPPKADSSDAPESSKSTPKRRGGMTFGPGRLEVYDYPTSTLAQQLGYMVGKTVNDKTGLTGHYDFLLEYTPEEVLTKGSDTAGTDDETKPDLFTALQEQLGLKLVPSKGPVRTLVIDHAELPTAN